MFCSIISIQHVVSTEKYKQSYRLNKLKLLFLLHLLYFENIFKGRVIKELPLLINLGVSLRMSKQAGG